MFNVVRPQGLAIDERVLCSAMNQSPNESRS